MIYLQIRRKSQLLCKKKKEREMKRKICSTSKFCSFPLALSPYILIIYVCVFRFGEERTAGTQTSRASPVGKAFSSFSSFFRANSSSTTAKHRGECNKCLCVVANVAYPNLFSTSLISRAVLFLLHSTHREC